MSDNPKYVIEQGVPIPDRIEHGNRDPDSLFGVMRRMNVGDSILLLPLPGKTLCQQRGNAYASARAMRTRDKSNVKFTIKNEGEGLRVWRIE